MKKIISFLIACSIFLFQCTSVNANSPLSEKGVDSFVEKTEDSMPIDKNVLDIPKEDTKEKNKKKPCELQEYQDDSEEYHGPSKWEMAKNVAVYVGKSFLNDVKSYVKFYPLHQIAQAISFCLWYFPAYALYKKTGIDIPAKLSSYITSENAAIFARNIYNVIPMTLTSFLYKWGRDIFAYMKR